MTQHLQKGRNKGMKSPCQNYPSFPRKCFKQKVRKAAKKLSRSGKDSFQEDNSLATRMARRDKLESEIDQPSSPASKAYAGQMLEQDDKAEVDGSWLRARFKCKKNSNTGDHTMGGDGRNMDDYDVVDGRGLKGDHHGKRRRGNHHSRDRKHHNRT